MASTSISSSVTIGLRNIETGTSIDVPAFEVSKATGRADIYLAGIVSEEGVYDISLRTDRAIDGGLMNIAVNGGDYMKADVALEDSESQDQVPFCYSVVLQGNINKAQSKDSERLFQQTYGFVRIEVNAPGLGNYVTMDIPCECTESIRASDVRAMLEELLSTGNQTVADWMFSSDEDDVDRYALLESEVNHGRSASILSFLELVQSSLDTYQSWLSYFRSSGYCTISSDTKRLSGFDVRQFGVDEFTWLMRNTEVLSEVQADTGFSYNGRNYFPRHIDTEVKSKSYDNYENRVVICFLDEIISVLRSTVTRMDKGVKSMSAYISQLNQLSRSHNLPALVVLEECVMREKSLIGRVETQQFRAQRLLRSYRAALPGVREQRGILTSPKRTKVFQEVRAYSAVYHQLERWKQFGEFTLARENLALHALRLDKLYEYYTLYKLLHALSRNGYALDLSYVEPSQRVGYSLQAPNYANEEVVNTLYRLASGERKVSLYYQPVIYGSMQTENGISLHRKSPRAPFAPISLDAYYLPDFLIVFECEGDIKTYIIDAKYSALKTLTKRGGSKSWSKFNETYFKYHSDTVDENLSPVDAVWLLAGKEDIPGVKLFETSTWISSVKGFVFSGIAPVSPLVNNLDDVFGILGIVSAVDGTNSHVEGGVDVQDIVENAEVPKQVEKVDTEETGEDEDSDIPYKVFSEEDTGLGERKTAIINRIERLSVLYYSAKKLRIQRTASSLFGVNRPVIRDRKPSKGRELRKYSLQNLTIGKVYVLVEWEPYQLTRLDRFIEQQERKNAEGKKES